MSNHSMTDLVPINQDIVAGLSLAFSFVENDDYTCYLSDEEKQRLEIAGNWLAEVEQLYKEKES